MSETNPYAPPDSAVNAPAVVPHSTSIITEAWRGAKYGAKMTAIGTAVFSSVFFLFIVGLLIWSNFVTTDPSLRVPPIEGVKAIGGLVLMVPISSFMGGVIGAIIMALTAGVRKVLPDRQDRHVAPRDVAD